MLPGKLDLDTDKGHLFAVWESKWHDYCSFSGLAEQDAHFQMVTLRAFLSDSCLQFISTLPQEEAADVSSVIAAMRQHAWARSNSVSHRRKFNLRHQLEGESFDDFLNDLLCIMKACEFCTACADSLVRDRIVAGIRDQETVLQLLQHSDLTLDQAIRICRQREKESSSQPEAQDAALVFKSDAEEAGAAEDGEAAVSELLFCQRTRGPDRTASSGRRERSSRRQESAVESILMQNFGDLDQPEDDVDNGDDDDDDDDEGDDDDVEDEEDGLAEEFRCDQCQYGGKSRAHLQRHLMNQHAAVKPYPCEFCDRSFGMKVRLTRHVQAVHHKLRPFVCPICSASFSKKSSLKIHVQSVHDKLKPFKCNECDAKFTQAGHLNRHKLTIHRNIRKYKCDVCDKRCASQSDLNAHVRNNHGDLQCTMCGQKFNKKSELRLHLLSTHGYIKPHLCESCGKSYMTQCTLNAHMTREHGQPEVPCDCKICSGSGTAGSAARASRTRDTRRPHLCELCGRSYTHLPGLKYHLQTAHDISDKVCRCEACQNNEQCILESSSKPHKHRPHKCMLCKSSFTLISSLAQHISTVHSKEKRFHCNVCQASFSSHKQLVVHIRSIHLGIRPYECPHCQAKFSQLGHRNRHVSVVHEGLKRYECSLCERKYANKTDLNCHLKKIHGRLIQLECELCNAKFDLRKQLMAHISDQHQPSTAQEVAAVQEL